MQGPVASEVEYIGISFEGFRLLSSIARDSVLGAVGFLDTFGSYKGL